VNKLITNRKEKGYVANHVIYLDEINSTNDYAKSLLNSNPANGTGIIAKKQTNGRGQQDHNWSSPEGGLYYTCILNTNLIQNITMITLACGLACHDAIVELTGLNTYLKWVNDIMVNKKKLGGILVESRVRGDNTKLIIGIGINVNNKLTDLPNNLKNITTTLFEETLNYYYIQDFVRILSDKIEEYFELYKSENYKLIKLKWLQHSNILGKIVKTAYNGYKREGIVIDIEDSGALIVQEFNGNIHYIINSSEIIQIN